MSEHFPNAPITEALIDIRTHLPETITADTIVSLHDKIKKEYPTQEERRAWQGKIELGKSEKMAAVTQSLGTDGYFFRSEDGRNVVQYRLDGFSFSRLKPYTDWESVYSEAMKLWALYRDHLKPLEITRIALRNINLIHIPFKTFKLEDYLVAPPAMPEGLGEVVVLQFLNRIVFEYSQDATKVVVTQASQPQSDPGSAAIILDIDAFREVKLAPFDQNIDILFRKLRTIKNDVFSKLVTEEAKKLFRSPPQARAL